MKLIIAFLAILSAAYAQIEPFDTEICRLFANGVKLREPGTCMSYITCKDGVSTFTDCNGKVYDKSSGKCSKSSDKYCSDPCAAKSPTWVTDPKSCSGYYKCVEGVGQQRYCPYGQNFYQTGQSCIFAEESACKGYAYCDVVPDNVPFKYEADCHKYYMCVKGTLKVFICDDGYYDARNGCMKRSDVECLVHPIPIAVCGTDKLPIRNTFVTDRRTCRGYFYCQDSGEHVTDLQPAWGQCPEGRFFDYDTQACYPPAAVVCNDDRCDGRNRIRVISGTKGCQHYLVCEANKKLREEKCPNETYFNDDLMACTSNPASYAACN